MNITYNFWYSIGALLIIPDGTKADLCLQVGLPPPYDVKVRATDCIFYDLQWWTQIDSHKVDEDERYMGQQCRYVPDEGYFVPVHTATVRPTHFMFVRLPQ